MYELAKLYEVENYVKNGKDVLAADFFNEDVFIINDTNLSSWIKIRNDNSGRYVFAVKVED